MFSFDEVVKFDPEVAEAMELELKRQRQNIELLDETEGPFASGAVDVLLDAPEVADPVAAPAAPQFGIGRNGGHGKPSD